MADLSGSASVEIDAPIEQVWEVVEDVLDAPNWQGGLDGMSALEHDDAGRPTLVETENDLKVRRVKTRVRFDLRGTDAAVVDAGEGRPEVRGGLLAA